MNLKPGRLAGMVLAFCFFCSFFFACERSDDLDELAQASPNAGLIVPPHPEADGSFSVCTNSYSGFAPDGADVTGIVYLPIGNPQFCLPGQNDHPLVIITPWNTTSNFDNHLEYDDLGTRLASHGFVVAVIRRDQTPPGGVDEAVYFPTLLDWHFDHLFTTYPGVISDDMALLGHSSGGGLVNLNAGHVNASGFNLKAVVNLATTNSLNPSFSFQGESQSYLGILGISDNDISTWGNASPGNPMTSTFKVYDEAGVWGPAGGSSQMSKNMVYGAGVHEIQDVNWVLAYVTAHLQTHLAGRKEYGRFLRHQETFPGFTPNIFIQHAENGTRVLSNFDNGNANFNSSGGLIFTTNGIDNFDVGQAYLLDAPFSPHNTEVAYFDWRPIGSSPHQVSYNFPAPEDLSSRRYLSFRISQVYDPNGQAGTAKDIQITLDPAGPARPGRVRLSDYGMMVEAPIVAIVTAVGLTQDKTKNAMRTYTIPLADFGVDLDAIAGVGFDFSINTGNGASFVMDDVEFLF